ncbi:MAG: polysaccharide biosynthesis tyrosine autokinase [Acidobacteria bacterium]|nr:polysaccharide biosynthesis tyrosine autokinase [Acidobacteriota bacterium]
MSRVHDALRKAQQLAQPADPASSAPPADQRTHSESHTSAPPPVTAAPVVEAAPIVEVHTPVTAHPVLETRPVAPEPAPSSSRAAIAEAIGVALAEPPAPVAAPVEQGLPRLSFGGRSPMTDYPTPAHSSPINGAPAIRTSTFAIVEGSPSINIDGLLDRILEVPFTPAPDAHLIDASRPHEAPTEEFRTLRTRLNHLQSLQPIHSIVVTSPSPAEGKSLGAVNLALAESQLSGNLTLLADFDFRRPIVHQMFQLDRSPGITDFLLGKAKIEDCIRKISGTSLCVMPAGEAVINPLELLNLPRVKDLLTAMPKLFNWVILDSPPLLFAADASLLGTMCDGTILVVRIGRTTIDSVTRALNSLCENNMLGIIVNGARRGELYSKYTYYHSYYYSRQD